MKSESVSRPAGLSAAVLVTIAALIGLIILPGIFGGVDESAEPGLMEAVWLLLSIGCAIWILAMCLPIAHLLAHAFSRLDATLPRTGRRRVGATAALAYIVVAAAAVLLVQAMVRHPLALSLRVFFLPSEVEATFAALVLAVVLVLLIRAYELGRPLAQGLAWRVLDSVVSTSGSAAAEREFVTASQPRTAEPTQLVAPRS